MTTSLSGPDLAMAAAGSYYTILGTGGDLGEWVDFYEERLAELWIGRPDRWYRTMGGLINEYRADSTGCAVVKDDRFPVDLTVLMFPLDGLDVGRLAMFRLRMRDQWFDDLLANMRQDERRSG